MVSVRPSYGGYLEEYCGLSADSKPTHNTVVNGSTFVEMDTGKRYRYDRENKVWFEYSDDVGGGGGSSTSVAPLLVPGTFIYTGKVPIYMLSVKAGELFSEFQRRSVYIILNDGEYEQYSEIESVFMGRGNYIFNSFLTNSESQFYAEGANSYPYVYVPGATTGGGDDGGGDDSGGISIGPPK